MISSTANVGKSLIICIVTLVLLNRCHSHLFHSFWIRRGASIVNLIIVCFNNPKSFISLSTSTLCLILIINGTSRRVIVSTFKNDPSFLRHILFVESIRSVSRLSTNLVWFISLYSHGFNSFDEFRARCHMSVRAVPRHSRYSRRD